LSTQPRMFEGRSEHGTAVPFADVRKNDPPILLRLCVLCDLCSSILRFPDGADPMATAEALMTAKEFGDKIKGDRQNQGENQRGHAGMPRS
jgi:hypothetical protein